VPPSRFVEDIPSMRIEFEVSTRKLVATLGLVLGGVAIGWGVKAVADGIPQMQPLQYSGTVLENGLPFTGARDIVVSLWDSAITGAGAKKCETAAPGTMLTSGRFRVALASECTAAVRANPELWVEVTVAGTMMPRKKLSAVPFAMEADRAASASGPLETRLLGFEKGVVPARAVLFFARTSCPDGWVPYEGARGRYVVGMPTGGTLEGISGTALSDLESRPVGQHTHAVSDPGHSHAVPRAGNSINNNWTQGAGDMGDFLPRTTSEKTGITIESAGFMPGTNAPYVQLLACQKS
jgi:hypothetical protein